VSNPTWANHNQIFEEVGFSVLTYRYYDPKTRGLDFAGLLEDLGRVEAGDVVLLHACCHNPSGVDPSEAEWRQIADRLAERGALPLVDFAYQGFGAGLEEDAAGVRILAAKHAELLICSSFSKNFGLYNERTGALTVTAGSAAACSAALSQLKICARVNYSNPPAHGGAIITTILGDAALRAEWESELAAMRDRIAAMRRGFVEGLAAAGVPGDFSFIVQQKGMFSFSGLTKEQVKRLETEHAIYIVGSGRINVAGITADNLPVLCRAIASVR
jgi:aspartate/tyrosine/aromatic aminotransferase